MANISIAAAQATVAADVSNKIQFAVAVKAQDVQKQQGAEIIAMLEAAAEAAKRGGVDAYA